MYPGAGRVHATGAYHGFHEHRRHSLRSDPRECLLHLRQGVVAHLDRLGQRPETHAVAWDTAERGSEPVSAVIAGGAADQDRAVRLADLPPVSACQLGRGVDPVATARAEEDLRRHRRSLGERLRELECRPVGEIKERRVRREALHLVGDGGANLGSAVPDVRVPQTAGGVQVSVPVRVPQPHVIRTLDHELGMADRTHVCVRMPKRCFSTQRFTSSTYRLEPTI